MTRPWSFGFAEKNSHKDGNVLKQIKCSLKGKEYVWIDTQADSKRELQRCALIVAEITYKGHYFQVSFS